MNLLTSGKWNGYLADINEQAEEMFSWLVKQFACNAYRYFSAQRTGIWIL